MNDGGVEKIDLEKVDWRGSREFFESLGEALDKLDDKDESYDFTWVGKRKAVIEAGAPINKTFRPDVKNSKNWDTTENLFIEGDNLDALKLLQESYLGKVKMIYIDPPYNTGKDFVYRDNFKASTEQYDEDTEYKDDQGNIQFKKNEKSNGRYHSDWLSMMYPRLKLARNLLADDGAIFISIDDNEQANLKKLCDEIFGEDNFIAQLVWKKKTGSGTQIDKVFSEHEYVFAFVRNNTSQTTWRVESDADGNFKNPDNDSRGPWESSAITAPSKNRNPNQLYKIVLDFNGDTPSMNDTIDSFDYEGIKIYFCGVQADTGPSETYENNVASFTRRWAYIPTSMRTKFQEGRVYINGKNLPRYKKFESEYVGKALKSIYPTEFSTQQGSEELRNLFDGNELVEYPKPLSLIVHLAKAVTTKDSIVLDFFSGSATTAHAVMQLNAEDGGSRKYIMVQLPEETDEKSEAFKAGYKTIPEISRERIHRAGNKTAAEHPDAKVDYGFRALTIADTNYKDVFKPAVDYQQSTLLDTVDNIKDDRSELDLLFGVLTQSAFELNKPLETRDIAGSNVFLYDYFGEVSGLVACFADTVSEETIKEIAKLKPLTAVFRDSSFASSQAKVNLSEHFRILSSDTKVKVI